MTWMKNARAHAPVDPEGAEDLPAAPPRLAPVTDPEPGDEDDLEMDDGREANLLRMCHAFLEPLRVEVGQVQGPECDMPLRTLLGELHYDLEAGLTEHTTSRNESALAQALPTWFDARKAAWSEREEQFGVLLEQLGESLFKLESGDQKSTARIRDGLTHLDSGAGRTNPAQMKRIVDNVVRALDDMKAENARRVQSMSSKIRELHEQVVEKTLEAQTDRLTGLNNRATFDDRLARMIRKSRLAPYRYTLLIMDVDHFKAVNDTHGHVEGDRVLKAVAEELEKVVMRKSDFLARYGGEEFAVLLADADGEAGRGAAERVREAVEAMELTSDGKDLRVTISIGVAEGCRTDSPNRLIKRADDSLYIAKKTGRNRVVVAGHGPGARVRLPPELTDRVRRAAKAKRAKEQMSAREAPRPKVISPRGRLPRR